MIDPKVEELLKVGTKAHSNVLKFLQDTKRYSDEAMGSRRDQFDINDQTYRAYINLEEASKSRKNKAREDSDYPGTVPIAIPMTMAGVHSMLTFLLSVFGRKPTIPIAGRTAEEVDAARKMEGVIAYQMDHDYVRGILKLFYWFQDALIYGCGYALNGWDTVIEKRVSWGYPSILGREFKLFGQKRTVRDTITYEGNTIKILDPKKCYPDPRVSLSELQKGAFFGYCYNVSMADLEDDDDTYFNLRDVDRATDQRPLKGIGIDDIRQTMVAATMSGQRLRKETPGFPEIFECWAKVRPDQLGLPGNDRFESWVFAMANDRTVIRGEKVNSIAGPIPVSAIEYVPCTHQFMNQGFVEQAAGIQDHFSWIFNSRMEAVRRVQNHTTFIDPSVVEIEDLQKDKFVRYPRMKPHAAGMDIKKHIYQMDVMDPTAGYSNDLMVLWDIWQRVTGLTDSILGLPAKGRRTALEMGGVQAAAAGRLKMTAEIFSLSGVIPLAKMMVLNTQQYMQRAIWVSILGQEGMQGEIPVEVPPNEIAGEFRYLIADGTAPLDKYRMAEVWERILVEGSKVPTLATQIDFWKVFKQIGLALDIKNIDDFRVQAIAPQILPDQDIANKVRAGNMIPLDRTGGVEFGDLGRILGPRTATSSAA